VPSSRSVATRSKLVSRISSDRTRGEAAHRSVRKTAHSYTERWSNIGQRTSAAPPARSLEFLYRLESNSKETNDYGHDCSRNSDPRNRAELTDGYSRPRFRHVLLPGSESSSESVNSRMEGSVLCSRRRAHPSKSTAQVAAHRIVKRT